MKNSQKFGTMYSYYILQVVAQGFGSWYAGYQQGGHFWILNNTLDSMRYAVKTLLALFSWTKNVGEKTDNDL